jgi:hypothetical protein
VPTPPTPAERFDGVLFWLSQAVASRQLVGLLAAPLLTLILDRLRAIKQSFARLAARIQAGRYAPRRAGPRPPTQRKPRSPNKLPQGAAWLIRLVPEAAASASHLRLLLADPEMAALLAAAPSALARPLRSLCRMLDVAPPSILPRPPARPSAKAPPRPRIPREKPEPGFSPSRPMGRVRYVFGLRYPPPLPDPA